MGSTALPSSRLIACFLADDFNRVVLNDFPGQEHSDYINASYVDVRVCVCVCVCVSIVGL